MAAEKAKAEQDVLAEQQRQQMLQAEAERKANIQSGNSTIDQNFAQFDDGYFGKIRDAHAAVYNPQIDDQFTKAKDKLIASLAGRGVLSSSVGAQALSDLEKRAGDERVRVGNDALAYANSLKAKVGESKNNLYAQSSAAADPNAIARSATGEATTLAQQGAATPTQPLSDVFSSFLTPFLSAATASQNSVQGSRKLINSTLAPISSGTRSSSVVGG
ncbi:MAG TPA: hypothetical protein VIU82_26010 [Bosea sp. (in: a-proteobacteria)]